MVRYWSITRAVEYLSFRTESTVTFMICLVWGLSAIVSMPLLVYPPWRLPFRPPRDDQIKFNDANDRKILDKINATEELVYSRCSVSPQPKIIPHTQTRSTHIWSIRRGGPKERSHIRWPSYLLTSTDL